MKRRIEKKRAAQERYRLRRSRNRWRGDVLRIPTELRHGVRPFDTLEASLEWLGSAIFCEMVSRHIFALREPEPQYIYAVEHARNLPNPDLEWAGTVWGGLRGRES